MRCFVPVEDDWDAINGSAAPLVPYRCGLALWHEPDGAPTPGPSARARNPVLPADVPALEQRA